MNASTTLERRRWFLKASMVLQLFVSALFYLIEQTEYDHNIHLGGFVCYLLLLIYLQRGRSYQLAAHLGFAVGIVHIMVMSVNAGGINATAVVWMTVVTLPSIMLLNRRSALMWASIAVGVNLLLFMLTRNGWMDSHKLMDNDVIGWTLLNKALVVILALGVVYMADYMHRQQTSGLDRSNRALEETHIALKQAQAHKEEFIASVGHELRTPMNAILGLNGILRTELSASKEDILIVDHIRKSTEQLLQVVNDILDFSQLQAGQLPLQDKQFALVETVQEVMAQYQEKVSAKSLVMRLQASNTEGLWVSGDRNRLVQVLRNLLDNAVKFTLKGHILVRIDKQEQSVRFEIEDTGIGIPADRQQQVFDRFEFADLQTNRQYGGTGLGLSICERLVSLQGGHIGVKSVQGQGTTFWFELPLKIIHEKSDETDSTQLTRLLNRSFRVLLVDDNAVNLMVAGLMMKKLFKNVVITEAKGGAQALECLKNQEIDLVLMDMVMPDVDGLQATQSLRQDFPAPLNQIPVLGLTASTHPQDRERCIKAGMNEVLSKPLDESQVIRLISEVLKPEEKGMS